MPSLKEVDRQIATKEAEIEALKAKGDPLYDRCIDSSRGRASSKTPTTYYRLRWMEGGKRMSKKLAASEKPEYEMRIKLGCGIQALHRDLEALHQTKAALAERISRIAG